jgi:cold shock CspA family protein
MAKSKETFGKKENRKKKMQKQQEKAQKKEERKANSKKGQALEDMMAWVDEDGNISSTPPDDTRKKEISAHEIELDISKRHAEAEEEAKRTGILTNFNTMKGFGFIRDLSSKESIFVHINSMIEPLKENDRVNFEIERTSKGLNAVRVKKAK